ncbi:hypothetical protein PILCRDRAFT_828324 [Piloderma croceum F 1598]|uniref:Uncharacterized protein n=1 Tax=Piloderma croceum (strain F 1598) TaxID=765440 RepID=A0A0C3F302_PILCF|nr:hypothetical protein PILCRDRAFT_828324 [Piloderma croceum F 1598]
MSSRAQGSTGMVAGYTNKRNLVNGNSVQLRLALPLLLCRGQLHVNLSNRIAVRGHWIAVWEI